MVWRQLPCALLALAAPSLVLGASPNTIEVVGQTLVSAMMMFLGSESKLYILDKVEANPTQLGDHSAWAAEWDLETNTARPMEVITNPFCSSGMHLPNGSFITFGGNSAIGPGGGKLANETDAWNPTYLDFDGRNVVRILNPCQSGDSADQCVWFDNSTKLLKGRWYSTAEPLSNGTVVVIGGFAAGGYVNRNWQSSDPVFQHGASEPTYETFPSTPGFVPPVMDFLVKAGGLNSYPHTFLMPSGKLFLQANYSTMLWDADTNVETPLPDIPGQIPRVYPSSGGVAMLPLTPANNYTPTILFCGGTYMDDYSWGNYSWPFVNTWEIPASKDCQRITPEPADGSAPVYVQDDDLIDGRTMGQFIILPDGTIFYVNGAANGTAGYSQQTLLTPTWGDMPLGMSLAAEPVLTPAIYSPNKPAGSRWSNAGLGASTIPRLYHSSAMLLPDASVMIAGSNPNVDYNGTTIYATEYRAEKFYPWYWGSTRPVPQGMPTKLSYGGASFDVSFGNGSYTGNPNDAAANSTVVVVRGGFTTHAMNMGQRFMQLNNTYTVSDNGTITLHVSQMYPNANLFQPGPALIFLVVAGVPSNGTMVIIGTGDFGTQPLSAIAALPPSVNATLNTSGGGGTGNGGGGGGSPTSTKSNSTSTLSTGVKIGIAAGGAAVVIFLVGLLLVCMRRRKSRNGAERIAGGGLTTHPGMSYSDAQARHSDAFIPLQQYNNSAWDISNASQSELRVPVYSDMQSSPRGSHDIPKDSYDAGNYYDTPSPRPDPRFGNGGRAM